MLNKLEIITKSCEDIKENIDKLDINLIMSVLNYIIYSNYIIIIEMYVDVYKL